MKIIIIISPALSNLRSLFVSLFILINFEGFLFVNTFLSLNGDMMFQFPMPLSTLYDRI